MRGAKIHASPCVKRDWHGMSSLFLDTNFFLDLFDTGRPRHVKAKSTLALLLERDTSLYTSADIISTLSYFLQKRFNLKQTVVYVDYIVEQITVLAPSNADLLSLNAMLLSMLKQTPTLTIDYEDCMQLFLADKHGVEGVLTSDMRFCRGVAERYDVKVVNLIDII